MLKNKLPTDNLDDVGKMNYHGMPALESLYTVAAFVGVLILAYTFVSDPYGSKLLAIYPRSFPPIPAIFLSHFLHASQKHLIGNLIVFVPLGFLVLNFEGVRGIAGIFSGMVVAGVAGWLFGSSVTIGFSGAVFACWGILLISFIRRDYLITIIFIFLSYLLLESALFETIRPTGTTETGNISWLAHLGGLIGGMAAQIKSLPVALELLYKNGKITQAEFVAIANRINNDEDAEDKSEEIAEADGDSQNTDEPNADSNSNENNDKPKI